MNSKPENRIPWRFIGLENNKDFPWLYPDLKHNFVFPWLFPDRGNPDILLLEH